jgi:hypothetical protein
LTFTAFLPVWQPEASDTTVPANRSFAFALKNFSDTTKVSPACTGIEMGTNWFSSSYRNSFSPPSVSTGASSSSLRTPGLGNVPPAYTRIESSITCGAPPKNDFQKIWIPTMLPAHGVVSHTATSSFSAKHGQMFADPPSVSESFFRTSSSATTTEDRTLEARASRAGVRRRMGSLRRGVASVYQNPACGPSRKF